MQKHWHYLLPKAFLVYCLDVATTVVVKACSALGFILAGLVNDIVIVAVSSHGLGDVITCMQYTRFAEFTHGMWRRLHSIGCGFLKSRDVFRSQHVAATALGSERNFFLRITGCIYITGCGDDYVILFPVCQYFGVAGWF